MSGAASFVLGLLGLGASAGINAGQSIKQKKADYQYGEECGLHGTPDVLRMRERVRKEWWDVCGKVYNACEKPVSYYGSPYKTPLCYCKKRWFIAHLNEKGIPYDDVVVNDVTGVRYYEHAQNCIVISFRQHFPCNIFLILKEHTKIPQL